MARGVPDRGLRRGATRARWRRLGGWEAVRGLQHRSPARGSDVLYLTTLDHPGAGVARDGGGEQREYAYYVFQDSCMRAICKEPVYLV